MTLLAEKAVLVEPRITAQLDSLGTRVPETITFLLQTVPHEDYFSALRIKFSPLLLRNLRLGVAPKDSEPFNSRFLPKERLCGTTRSTAVVWQQLRTQQAFATASAQCTLGRLADFNIERALSTIVRG